jgi:hypothetical protein
MPQLRRLLGTQGDAGPDAVRPKWPKVSRPRFRKQRPGPHPARFLPSTAPQSPEAVQHDHYRA